MIEVKRYQVVFFDLATGCFDEAFYEPSEAETALDFLRPVNKNMDASFMVTAKVFVIFNDGRQFELVYPKW